MPQGKTQERPLERRFDVSKGLCMDLAGQGKSSG